MPEKHANSDSVDIANTHVKKSRHNGEPEPRPESTRNTHDRLATSNNAVEVKTDDALVHSLIISQLSLNFNKFHPDPQHTQKSTTRGPDDYDAHLPASLRLEGLAYGPGILTDLRSVVKTRFLQRPEVLKILRLEPHVPQFITAIQMFPQLLDRHAFDETNVTRNESIMIHLANILSTYALFDLDAEELTRVMNMPNVFECVPSPEPETKAELFNRLTEHHMCLLTETDKQFLDEIPQLPYTLGVQLKNIIDCDPRCYLAILLLIAVMPKVRFPWPENICRSCEAFPLTHAKLNDMNRIPKPLDASVPEPPIGGTDDELKAAITAIQNFIIKRNRRFGDICKGTAQMSAAMSDDCTTQAEMDIPKPSTPESRTEFFPGPGSLPPKEKDKNASKMTDDFDALQRAINNVFDSYDVDVALRPSLSTWLLNAVHLTIKSWSQMVRHDLTYHIVSSQEVAWVIHRHRESQTATISGFFHPRDQPLLTRTGLVIRSYEDALTRLQEGKCRQVGEDVCRRQARRDEELNGHGDSGDYSLHISDLHLAFRWDTLQSEGCTRMTRVIPTDPPAREELHTSNLTTSESTFSANVKSSSSGSMLSMAQSLTMSPSLLESPAPTRPLDGSCASEQPAKLETLSCPKSISPSLQPPAGTNVVNDEGGEAMVPILQPASAPTFSKAGVVLDTLIATTGIARVWGGCMVIEGLGIDKSVVIKMVTDQDGAKRLLQEGAIYEHLARSTPAAGPRCYGVFQSENGSTVLLMDDLGDALESFEHCSDQQKDALLDEAITLHNNGVYHNDLEPRNVVVDQDGMVHIIDYHIATLDHNCPGTAKCAELADLAYRLGLSF